jgi:hypothetical protein
LFDLSRERPEEGRGALKEEDGGEHGDREHVESG